jgi:hypothetical protein
MSTYNADVSRGERYWSVYVREVDRVTQARNLAEVELMARDLVAVMDGVDAESVELAVHISMPGAAAEHWQQAKELRDVAERTTIQAAEESRRAAKELADTGVTVRDIGQLLGISFQRAGQLVQDKKATKTIQPGRQSARQAVSPRSKQRNSKRAKIST